MSAKGKSEPEQHSREASTSLLRARLRYAARAWADAYDAFVAAGQEGALAADDLQLMAVAAGLSGNDAAMLEGMERAHHAYVADGRELPAARAAFWAGYRLMPLGEVARAQAWFARAQRIVERVDQDCVERGYLLLPGIMRQLFEGDPALAEASASAACEIAERFCDPDLLALARIVRGRALLKQAKVSQGLSQLDEAMLAATSQELSPVVTGLIYCHVISACSQVYALDRAREWTVALGRWCDPQPQLGGFAGTCMVHRAELLELSGAWNDSIAEARRAEQRLSLASDPKAAADALYQQAEIHRLRGELAQAEDAYGLTSRAGREPLPGLALLRLAQGRTDVAASAMRRIVATTREPLQRARYLPAYAEVMLAAGDLPQARVASDELVALAASFDTPVLRALAAQAEASVLLAEGNADAAVEPLRQALLVWQRMGAPYLVARLHALLGRAFRALGDEDGAQLEWNAARDGFAALGAQPDLSALATVQGALAPSTRERSDGAQVEQHGLSARELEVLRLLATGKTNRAIARELYVSDKTIDRHVSNIFGKLDVSSRAAATAFAYEHRLL